MKLLFSALIKYLFGILLVGLLIFLPAGTFKYFEGILFMCLLFIPMFIFGIILFIKDPKLLESRLKSKEENNTQKSVVLLSGLMFILGFVLSGLNYKYEFIIMPRIVVYIFSIIFLISYILYAIVLRENSYLSRIIEVQKDQKVIDSGMYSIVRHPMYAVTIIMFLSIPFVLNSILSFIVFWFYPLLISKRIENEEEVLEKDLKGYKEYKKKVKYKLIPFIW